ncbi:hypothetical protein MLD38_024703 [Melastoma candidum]|uniref:Uncharacterized protein n=1 Tax=Melastoma candidum TaxID=119954 RepID=A0ACB9NTG7_9MYRT|nr:hypothetical protein MLD38_024703 [Melastoma candidum]
MGSILAVPGLLLSVHVMWVFPAYTHGVTVTGKEVRFWLIKLCGKLLEASEASPSLNLDSQSQLSNSTHNPVERKRLGGYKGRADQESDKAKTPSCPFIMLFLQPISGSNCMHVPRWQKLQSFQIGSPTQS